MRTRRRSPTTSRQTEEEAVEEIVDDTFAETAEDAGVADVDVDEPTTDEADEVDEPTRPIDEADEAGRSLPTTADDATDDQGSGEASESKDS